jgi:hypothetical protein
MANDVVKETAARDVRETESAPTPQIRPWWRFRMRSLVGLMLNVSLFSAIARLSGLWFLSGICFVYVSLLTWIACELDWGKRTYRR